MICHCGLALSWSRISPIWLSVNIIIKSSRSTLLCGRVFNARHSANFFDKFLVRLFIMSSYTPSDIRKKFLKLPLQYSRLNMLTLSFFKPSSLFKVLVEPKIVFVYKTDRCGFVALLIDYSQSTMSTW